MITEPTLNKQELQQSIEEGYGIKINEMKFIPQGECSWSYQVTTEQDKKYFLKIYVTEIDEQVFQVLYDLFEKCGITNISHPNKNQQGKIKSQFESYTYALFNFIDGQDSKQMTFSDQQYFELGVLIGKIHSSVDKIEPFPKKETFSVHGDDFKRVMDSLDTQSEENDRFIFEMKDLIRKNKERIVQEYDEFNELQNDMLQKKIESLNCHGDPTPANLLVDVEGEIYLIDWDDPIYAPKEKDLVFLHHRSPKVMEGYKTIFPDAQLDQRILDYYIHQWNVGEIGGYGTLILDSQDQEEKQRQYHLDGFKLTLRDMGIEV